MTQLKSSALCYHTQDSIDGRDGIEAKVSPERHIKCSSVLTLHKYVLLQAILGGGKGETTDPV